MTDAKSPSDAPRDPLGATPAEKDKPDTLPAHSPDQESGRQNGLTPPDYDEYGNEPQQNDDR
jgi:hypothetical protein